MDDHYQKFVLDEEERMRNLQVQGDAEIETTQDAVSNAETTATESKPEPVSEEVREAAMKTLQ